MTACDAPASRAEIGKHFAGTISPSEERHIREHLTGCVACRAYYERHLLLAELDREAVLSAEERLAVGLGLAKSRRPARAPLLGAVVVAAAALVAIASPALWPRHSEFASRGAVTRGPEAELYVYRVGPGKAPQRADGTRMGRGDELAFAYTNRGGWPYLLVFGVDEHGHVYWYHPAWLSAEDTPAAVSIRPGPEGRELPDATSHELDGRTLHVFGLFSRSALTTRDVEAKLRARGTTAPAASDLRTAFPNSFVSELVLRVEEP